jgi:hypothetical protein
LEEFLRKMHQRDNGQEEAFWRIQHRLQFRAFIN